MPYDVYRIIVPIAISLTPDRLLCAFILALLRTTHCTRDIVRNTAACWERMVTNFPPLLLDAADKIRPGGSFLALTFRVGDRTRKDWDRFLHLASTATSVNLISRPQTTTTRPFNHLATISYFPFNITERHLIGFTVDLHHLFDVIEERQSLVSSCCLVAVLKISGIYKQVNVEMKKPAKFTQIHNQCRLLPYLASFAR